MVFFQREGEKKKKNHWLQRRWSYLRLDPSVRESNLQAAPQVNWGASTCLIYSSKIRAVVHFIIHHVCNCTPPVMHPQLGKIDRHISSLQWFRKQKKKKKETNHYKNKWLENSEQSCIIPFERCLGNLVCLQKCTKNGSCGCLCIAAAACILHSGFTGSEIRVCKCLYASSPSSVSEDSRAGKKRLRLILVLRETKCYAWISWLWLWEWRLVVDLWGAVWPPQKGRVGSPSLCQSE